jgi:hypothetical protein
VRLSPLELAVGASLAAQVAPAEVRALVAQLETAAVTSRKFTGLGFFTAFEVDRALAAVDVAESPCGWVCSQVGAEPYRLEFMIYLESGYAVMIEAFSMGGGYGDLDLLTAAFTPPEFVTLPQSPAERPLGSPPSQGRAEEGGRSARPWPRPV